MMSRIAGKPQSGYTQLLEGSYLSTARAVDVDVHHKHCYQIAKFLRGMNCVDAIEYLEKVIEQKEAIPYTRRSRKGRGGNTMAGHRKGKSKNLGRYGPLRTRLRASAPLILLSLIMILRFLV